MRATPPYVRAAEESSRYANTCKTPTEPLRETDNSSDFPIRLANYIKKGKNMTRCYVVLIVQTDVNW